MKKTYVVYENGEEKEKQIRNIPLRFILATLIIVLEILSVVGVIGALSIYVPYFYISVLVTWVGCVLSIFARRDNPDYKLPWLLFILVVPIVGFMCYLMFYSRNLSRRQTKKIDWIKTIKVDVDDKDVLSGVDDELIRSQALIIKSLSSSHLYKNTDIRYFSSGEQMHKAMIEDLKQAEEFIFLEYFIIEDGEFWGTILNELLRKVKDGVEVAVVYDDIGCMTTLPGNYFKQLQRIGVKCLPFSKLKGQANNEFNNRNHRKILVIDGKVGYTGGINIADEYINAIERFGYWKDVGVRLEGNAVNELTRLFIVDYEMSAKKQTFEPEKYFKHEQTQDCAGLCLPFGDGPKPLFQRQVAKTAIMNMLASAKNYVYITTPYLIIDNDLTVAIENAALRGVEVRIITPYIPDKKLILMITRSCYQRLISVGVKIYEYAPGFIHAKTYLADDKVGIVGTINLDYRSLVHHFENGVWIYDHPVLEDVKNDFLETQEKSYPVDENQYVGGWFKKFILATLKIFTPLL